MYPTLYHAFLDLFGVDWPVLRFLNSFGFFVAIAFVAAHLTLASELKRKQQQGLIQRTQRKVTVGAPPNPVELAMQALVGFLIGWKGVYLVMNVQETTADPPAFLLSGRGNFLAGLAVGALFAWLYWREKKKRQLPTPEERMVTILPAQHAGNITLTAALWGFIGAKVFNWFESAADIRWDHLMDLVRHPLDHLRGVDPKDIVTGLTMYGGLIVAGLMVMRYFRRNGLAFWPSVDSAAPGVLLAYAIGRLGCHVSGDGDWGIANAHPKPSWIPQWLWSYDYPNNVNAVLGHARGGYVGERITQGTCFEGYCTHLVPGVYPTPLYETIACLLLFGVLWMLRERIAVPGRIFSLFLIFDGLERFLIEKIRVNEPFIGTWTQAEVISLVLVAGGALLWWRLKAKPDGPAEAH